MSESARCKLLNLGDEFGGSQVLNELVMYLSESDCSEFLDHIFRVWDLNTYEDPEPDEEDEDD